MTNDAAAYRELGYLQAVLADVVMLVEDKDLDDEQLRRQLRTICAQAMKRPGVADVVAQRRRGDQS